MWLGMCDLDPKSWYIKSSDVDGHGCLKRLVRGVHGPLYEFELALLYMLQVVVLARFAWLSVRIGSAECI